LPDVPAIGEFVPGYAAAGWYGICAPRATPATVVDKLATTIVAIDTDRNFQARLKALGIDPVPMNTAEFGNFIADETEKWSKVIKFANVKPE
jgi:tripartite-type tricarboxylate transporter receptor subunit TctC